MVGMWVCILNRKSEFKQKDYSPPLYFFGDGVGEEEDKPNTSVSGSAHTYIGRREDLAEL